MLRLSITQVVYISLIIKDIYTLNFKENKDRLRVIDKITKQRQINEIHK